MASGGRDNKNWDTKERGWEQVQIKAFTSWINGILSKRDLSITDIRTDLSDGVKLYHFLEVLTDKKMKTRLIPNPPSRIEKIQNLFNGLEHLKELGVKTPGASAEDFADNNLKMLLGFFWSLFKFYRISTIKQDDKSSEQGLLLWVKKTTDGYKDVVIESYKQSFRNGLAFLALCDKFIENPEIVDYSKFSKDNAVENLSAAFDYGEKHIGIPKLLDPQEVAEGNIDERSIVLYLSLYFHAFVAKEQQKGLLEQQEKLAKQIGGLQGTLEERARMAEDLQKENSQLKLQLEEERNRVKSLLEELEAEREARRKLELSEEELKKLLEEQKKKSSELEEEKLTLEGQISGLNGQVADLTTKFENESQQRKKEHDDRNSKSKTEVAGLNVLKKNLEEHLEDLYRWQKYLDLDKDSEVDFSGEIRPQILQDISKENWDTQLDVLSKKLAKENEELTSLLSVKEAEKKAKKEADKKKKERQQKNKT